MENFRGEKIRPDVVVTGEAIALLVQPASLFLRVISGTIDALTALVGGVFTAEIVILFFTFGPADSLPLKNEAQVSTFISVLFAFWAFFFPMLIETLTKGRTLGKFVAGTRVVRDDGGPITFRHAFIRALLGVAELWITLGSVAILTAFFSRRSKRLGDLFAGTYVITEPSINSRQPLLLAPEPSAWASGARVGEIDASLSIMARRFLQAAGRMEAVARRDAALKIASQLELAVYPPPPPRTDPERFIAAVLVLRRDLEFNNEASREANISQKLAAVSAPKYGI